MKQFRIELKSGANVYIDADDRETPETWVHRQPRYIRLHNSAFQEVDEIVSVIEIPSKKAPARSLPADWLPERRRCS